MIDGVADDVHQRIAQLLDDELVQLHLAAGDDEVDLLARLAGDAAHQPRQLVEHLAHRDHARFEQPALQRVQLALQLPRLARQLLAPQLGEHQRAVLPRRLGHALEVGLDEQQLAHRVHQPVQLADVHAHRLRERAQRGVELHARALARPPRAGPRHRAARTRTRAKSPGGGRGQGRRGEELRGHRRGQPQRLVQLWHWLWSAGAPWRRPLPFLAPERRGAFGAGAMRLMPGPPSRHGGRLGRSRRGHARRSRRGGAHRQRGELRGSALQRRRQLACRTPCAPKMRSNAMPLALLGCAEGSVLMISPTGLRREFSSASPLSKSDRSKSARTRHSDTPRRTFSRSRCSSYSVKTARTCASSSSRSSGSSSPGAAGNAQVREPLGERLHPGAQRAPWLVPAGRLHQQRLEHVQRLDQRVQRGVVQHAACPAAAGPAGPPCRGPAGRCDPGRTARPAP